MSKEIEDLNNTINQLDLKGIYGTYYSSLINQKNKSKLHPKQGGKNNDKEQSKRDEIENRKAILKINKNKSQSFERSSKLTTFGQTNQEKKRFKLKK